MQRGKKICSVFRSAHAPLTLRYSPMRFDAVISRFAASRGFVGKHCS